MRPEYQFEGRDAEELYDIAPCGYLTTAIDGTIVAVNRALLDLTGYDRDYLLASRRFHDLLSPAGRIFYETQYAPLLQMQGSVKAVAFDLVRSDSTKLPVLVNSVQRKNSIGTALIHTAIFDATDRRRYEQELLNARRELERKVALGTIELAGEVGERKRAEESLRDLTSTLLRLRDEEQRRLARALHDSVGQLLAGMAMNQAALAREKEKLSQRSRDGLLENIEMTEQILTEIRTISHLLHPPLLDEVGLGSALTWYVEGINKRSKIQIGIEISPEFGRLTPEMETAIFRIAQECLTNVHRHADCQSATVDLRRGLDFVALTITDDGHGMPASKVADIKAGLTSGVGLRGMRERIRQLHGNLDVTSSEQGTRFEVRLPAPASEA